MEGRLRRENSVDGFVEDEKIKRFLTVTAGL